MKGPFMSRSLLWAPGLSPTGHPQRGHDRIVPLEEEEREKVHTQEEMSSVPRA